jgi:CHAT domain-containing protein
MTAVTRMFRKVNLLVLLAALLPVVPATSRDAHMVSNQEEAPAQCPLKTETSNCAIRSGEEVRILTPSATLEREIAGKERHFYQVSVSAGQFMRAVVDQQGIDLTAIICTSNGQQLADVDRQSGSWGPESISLIANQTGNYLLQVKPLADAPAGQYQINLKELREVTALDEVRISAERIVTEGGKFYAQGTPPCLRESIVRYHQALKLWQSLGENDETAITLYGLGWSHTDLGAHGMVKFPMPRYRLRWNYESREDHLIALKYFQQSLELMRTSGNQHGQAIALAGLAWPNLYLVRSDEALKNFLESSQLFQLRNNKRGEAISIYGLGWAYALLNDNENARASFSRALTLRREVGDKKGEAATLAALSRIYSRLDRNVEALDFGQQALATYEALQDKRGRGSAHATLGWIYNKSGKQAEALESFQKSLALQRPTDDTGRANTLYGIARVYNDLNDLTKALSQMEEVLKIIEPLRTRGSVSDLRTYYFANVQEYYEFYVDLLMRLDQLDPQKRYAEAALGASERGRARELLAVLAESDVAPAPEYDEALTNPLDANGIRKLLDDETVLLEYFLGEERSYAWLVSSNEVHAYTLPKRELIETQAGRLYKLLTERNRRASAAGPGNANERIIRADLEADKVASALGQTLLSPMKERLKNKRLVIVTQGALQLIPMGALPVAGEGTNPAPLFFDHEIVNLPSSSILSMLRRKGNRGGTLKTIAVLADPVFTADDPRVRRSGPTHASTTGSLYRGAKNEELKTVDNDSPGVRYRRLLGTRWEAQQIMRVAKDGGFAALDFAASRKTAMSDMMSGYRIIHFATHAIVDDVSSARSKIVLSQFNEKGEPENGNLTLADLQKLRLRAELVVLSACQTGLGVDIKGEGLIGLTGGFMHSGVPRVLVSLWPISDRAAAEFMARFYRRLLGPRKLTPSAALREVQLETWKDTRWRSAYFWAPFVVNGDWNWE